MTGILRVATDFEVETGKSRPMTKSEKALAKKLSLKQPSDSYILHAPTGYALAKVKNLESMNGLPEQVAWLQAFYEREADLTHELPSLKGKLAKDGSLWICWPKKSANKDSDLSDNVVRSLGLACALIDIKVIAIDKIWSGLKFTYRLKDR